MTDREVIKFQKHVYDFYKKYGRVLPWRVNSKTKISSYKIFVSEFMLQQTQVERVIPKYNEFINKVSSYEELSKITNKEILTLWSGLGYNRRALYLKESAEIISKKYKGLLPDNPNILKDFPGIGSYMMNVLPVFIYNKPHVLIETNIRSVFIDYFFKNHTTISDKDILPIIKETLDYKNPRDWYYALMDYGSYIKKQKGNPNTKSKHHYKQKPFKDSNRFVRGQIIKLLLKESSLSKKKLYLLFPNYDKEVLIFICNQLAREKLIQNLKNSIKSI